jgi:hypothetical protein
MSSSQESSASKKPGKGKIVVIAFSAVIAIVATVFLMIPPEEKKECSFKSSSESGNGGTQTAVVFAPTSNFVEFTSVVARANPDIRQALGFDLPDKSEALGRELSLIVADSSPSLVVRSTVTSEGFDQVDISRGIESTLSDVEIVASCAGGEKKKPGDQVPTQDESDMLQAISVATDQFNTLESKKLFILGNGIQTSGAILMQDEGSLPRDKSSAKLLAKSLKKRGEIPDLTDVEVTWYGLGQVDGEFQKTLPLAKSKALETFWREIIRLGGGKVESICQQCGSGLPESQAIKVSPVDASACPVIVKLYESDGVEFKPDSDEFVSLAEAKSAARDTVAKFIAKKCESISVAGYAAAGEDEDTYENHKAEIDGVNKVLTKRRAAAFAKLLKSAGFEGEIKFSGMGTCGTEWNDEGKVVEKQQRLCRRVEVSN